MLTDADIANIEAFAALVRDGADLVDGDREAQRDFFQQLGLQASIFAENDHYWVDISCILGRFPSDTCSETSWCTNCNNDRGPG